MAAAVDVKEAATDRRTAPLVMAAEYGHEVMVGQLLVVVAVDVKVAAIMKHAPEQVRSFLRQQSHSIGDDYNLLDTVLSNNLISGRAYDGSGNFLTGVKPRGTYAQSY